MLLNDSAIDTNIDVNVSNFYYRNRLLSVCFGEWVKWSEYEKDIQKDLINLAENHCRKKTLTNSFKILSNYKDKSQIAINKAAIFRLICLWVKGLNQLNWYREYFSKHHFSKYYFKPMLCDNYYRTKAIKYTLKILKLNVIKAKKFDININTNLILLSKAFRILINNTYNKRKDRYYFSSLQFITSNIKLEIINTFDKFKNIVKHTKRNNKLVQYFKKIRLNSMKSIALEKLLYNLTRSYEYNKISKLACQFHLLYCQKRYLKRLKIKYELSKMANNINILGIKHNYKKLLVKQFKKLIDRRLNHNKQRRLILIMYRKWINHLKYKVFQTFKYRIIDSFRRRNILLSTKTQRGQIILRFRRIFTNLRYWINNHDRLQLCKQKNNKAINCYTKIRYKRFFTSLQKIMKSCREQLSYDLKAKFRYEIILKNQLFDQLKSSRNNLRRNIYLLVRSTMLWKLKKLSIGLENFKDWVNVQRRRRYMTLDALKCHSIDCQKNLMKVLLSTKINRIDLISACENKSDKWNKIKQVFEAWKSIIVKKNAQFNHRKPKARYSVGSLRQNNSLFERNINDKSSLFNGISHLVKAKPRTNIIDFLPNKSYSEESNRILLNNLTFNSSNYVKDDFFDNFNNNNLSLITKNNSDVLSSKLSQDGETKTLTSEEKRILAKEILSFVAEIKCNLQLN